MPLDLTNGNEWNNNNNKNYLFERIKQVKAFLKHYIAQQEKTKKTTTHSFYEENKLSDTSNSSRIQPTKNSKNYLKSPYDKDEDNKNYKSDKHKRTIIIIKWLIPHINESNTIYTLYN